MSGYQFFHLESYSFAGSKGCPGNPQGKTKTARAGKNPRLSIRQVIDEALRKEGACPHVATPLPPDIMADIDLESAIAELEQRASAAKDKLGRKLRRDKLLIMAGVASYPVPMAELDLDDPVFRDWAQRTLDYVYARWGEQCVAAVFHRDEAYPHLHFYVLPRDLDMTSIHPGVKAGQEAAPGKSKQAYSNAMRLLQDDYFEQVGQHVGLTRMGPGRRRLTRGEWKTEQAVADLTAGCLERQRTALAEAHDQLAKDRRKFVFAKSVLSFDREQLQAKEQRLVEEAKAINAARELVRLKESSIVVHTIRQLTHPDAGGEVVRLRRQVEEQRREIAELRGQLANANTPASAMQLISAHPPRQSEAVTAPTILTGSWGSDGPK